MSALQTLERGGLCPSKPQGRQEMESMRASPSLAEDKSTGKSGRQECAHSCEWLTGATSLGPCLGNYAVPGQLAPHSETQSQTL